MAILSVIIPFYTGIEFLERTLVGLAHQTIPPHLWEVIISEDGSPESTEHLIEKYPEVDIRRVRIERAGFRLATARNVGILSARGSIVLLLDFDCIPLPSHLEQHLTVLKQSNLTATVGLRKFTDLSDLAPEEVNRPNWWNHARFVPSISNAGRVDDKRIGELEEIEFHPCPSNLFHGCNVGFWRSTAIDCGLFNEEFNGAHGYEDLEFAWRLQSKGVKFLYVDAPVYHQENAIVGVAQRSEGRIRNYSILSRLAPGLADFRLRDTKSKG